MKKLFTCLMVVALLVSATFMLPVMAEENDTVVLVDYENQFLTDLLWATGYYGFETAAPLEGAASLQFNLESSEEWALQTWWGGIGLDQFHGNWVDMTPYEWMGMRVKNTDTEYDFEFSIDITFQNTASTAEAPIANVYLPIKTEQVYTCNADGSDFKLAELTETLYGGVASPFVLIPAGFDGWVYMNIKDDFGFYDPNHTVANTNYTVPFFDFAYSYQVFDGFNGTVLFDDVTVCKTPTHAPAGWRPGTPIEDLPQVKAGTPTVDGKLDGIYKDSASAGLLPPFYSHNNAVTADSSISATTYLLHDDNFLYIAAEVTDGKLIDSKSGNWINDCMEFYLDFAGGGVSADAFGGGMFKPADTTGFTYAATYTENSYIIEIAVPLGTKATGDTFRLGIQLNDLIDKDREMVVAYGVQTAEKEYYLSDVAATAPVETEAPTAAPTEAPTEAPTAPTEAPPRLPRQHPTEAPKTEGGCGGMVALGIAAALIPAAIVIRKRK